MGLGEGLRMAAEHGALYYKTYHGYKVPQAWCKFYKEKEEIRLLLASSFAIALPISLKS